MAGAKRKGRKRAVTPASARARRREHKRQNEATKAASAKLALKARFTATLRRLVEQALREGLKLKLEVGKPAPRRLALSPNLLRFEEVDGSDLYACVCCGKRFDMEHDVAFTSRVYADQMGVCPSCRDERLNEGLTTEALLARHAADRTERAVRTAIERTEARVVEQAECRSGRWA